MATTQATKDYNTFIKGLITESSALTYPPDASIDEENFVLNRDGSRQRRLGMDYEADYTLSSNIAESVFEDQAITVHKWNNADNSGLYSFSVVQLGTTLYFYDLSAASLSDNLESFTVDLNTYKTAYASNIGVRPVSMASGKGVLYVVSADTEPFFVEYNSAGGSISITTIDIKKRDFLGIDDGLSVETRPSSLSSTHEYNLKNQGWGTTNINLYKSDIGTYPSNADIWIIGKDSSDVFSPALLNKQYFGNTHAPTGHFILDAFTRDRTDVSGVSGITTELEEGRPSCVAFYAGRVWYSGIESVVNSGETVNGDVYFSQILTAQDKAGNCYQDADPTSEELSILLVDDGGVIPIPEVGRILSLQVVYDSLVVLADNGVWQIKGDSDAGFNALGYQVQKISSLGAISQYSIVTAENNLFYWADSGIYSLSPDSISGLLAAQNITQTSIQTLFNEIPSIAKPYVQGFYDVTSKRISWLYNDTIGYDGVGYRYKYNKELVLDIVISSFYKNSISNLASDTPYIVGAVTTPSLLTTDVAYNVVINGVQVQVNSVDMQISLPNPARGTVSSKYLTIVPQDASNSKVVWSLYNNTSFLEWEQADGSGVDFTSFLRTGYELFGDSMRNKSAPMLLTHFNRTETGFITNGSGGLDAENPSGCQVQARWDWSDTATSNRWSTSQQAYRLNRNYIPTGVSDTFDYGFNVITTKNKIRGKGRSLGFYFTSEAGKDMHLLGWSVKVTGETIP